MLYTKIIAVCSQINTKHINTLCGQKVELYIKIQSVPRRKHSSVIKTSLLMLYREIIAVCSVNCTQHTNTLCGQKEVSGDVNSAGGRQKVLKAKNQPELYLTFRHRASSIQDRHFATLHRTLFIYLINKYISLSDICLTVYL